MNAMGESFQSPAERGLLDSVSARALAVPGTKIAVRKTFFIWLPTSALEQGPPVLKSRQTIPSLRDKRRKTNECPVEPEVKVFQRKNLRK